MEVNSFLIHVHILYYICYIFVCSFYILCLYSYILLAYF